MPVTMAVVQIRPVRVAVRDRGVVVRVLVPGRRVNARLMRVIVVTVVVPVEVAMTERRMRVGVLVPLALPDPQRQRHQRGGGNVSHAQRFA
jgi:hypothetical protein